MVIGGIACTSLTVCALDLWVPLYLGRCVLLYISRCRYSQNPNKMTHYSIGCDPILNDRCYSVTTKYIYILTFLGNHTLAVQKGLNIGVILFIVSEAYFFLAIF